MKKRTKTISSVLLCGALMMNTGISAFAAGAGSSNVTLQVETGDEPAIVSVKVPTEIPLKMDKEGAVTVPQDLEIANLSDTTDVNLTGLSVVGKNGWSIKDYAADLASRPEGTEELSMSFRGDGTTDTGEVLLTPDVWTVAKDSALPLNIAAKLPKQGNDYVQKGDIAQVNYRFTVADDAGGEEETPDESVISNNWSKDKVLKDSVTPVTFNYDSTDPDTFIQNVESSDPSVTVARGAETYSLGNPGSEVWNVTAAAKGSATVTATLNTGETTQFDVNVYELNLGGDGSNTVTVPEVPDKGAGDSLETGDITIDIPITGPDGDDTITVTPDIPDDTVLEEGENTIDVTTDIDGVTVHITIIINIKSENPSNGLSQSVEEAQAMGFTFSSYEDGLQIDSFENKQFKSEVNVPEQIGEFKVLRIGDGAFDGESNLKKITLPDTIQSIGRKAFNNCSNAEIYITSPIQKDDDVFKDCYYHEPYGNGFYDQFLRDTQHAGLNNIKALHVTQIQDIPAYILIDVMRNETPIYIGEELYEYQKAWLQPKERLSYKVLPSQGFFTRLSFNPLDVEEIGKPYILVITDKGVVNVQDIDCKVRLRGYYDKQGSGLYHHDFFHEIDMTITLPDELGTVIDAFIPLKSGQYAYENSGAGINVHINVQDKHFDYAYGDKVNYKDIEPDMYYWCFECERGE